MHIRTIGLVTLALSSIGLVPPPARGDALDETLALVGMRRDDLGWRVKGWWPRWPDVPYKLRAFDALFAEPLDTIAYSRALGETAWTFLDPAKLDTKEGRNDGQLMQAVQRLGVDPKFGGFRGYSANLVAPPTPLDEAILKLIETAGRATRPYTFGWDLPYPKPREELAEKAKVVPPEVSAIVGQLVLNIADAQRWAELAFRKVAGNDRLAVATRFDAAEESTDAYDYIPQFDDVEKSWDQASLWYAGLKCVQALDDARVALGKLDRASIPAFTFEYETPWGWIQVGGTGPNAAASRAHLLIVDLGGGDTYLGNVAASTASQPISLVLDMGGDDTYTGGDQPTQGAGYCGVGILLDVAGNDTYEARRCSQGVGQFGLGVLVDLAGTDHYLSHYSSQALGLFGVGLLFDLDGDDRYSILADGQGFGCVNGVGVLADRLGNDTYVAERKHSLTRRPSYHSPELDVGVSNVQGVGMGRRGDGSDGHSWAGGLGALLDQGGNDTYTAGNWAQGTGYWFGIGVLHDRGGDDAYHSVAYGQASGAHFCIGVLVDEAGDDRHLAEENSNMSIAWGHDFTIAVCLDAGGDDTYRVEKNGLGYSINRSVAMLIDAGGADRYETRETPRPGYAMNDERFRARGGVSTYFADTTSIGLFLDIGGSDTYKIGPATTTQPAMEGVVADNSRWLDPPEAANWKDRNFSVGVDRAEGTVDFTPTTMRAPVRH
jgi:hypothetical protein